MRLGKELEFVIKESHEIIPSGTLRKWQLDLETDLLNSVKFIVTSAVCSNARHENQMFYLISVLWLILVA